MSNINYTHYAQLIEAIKNTKRIEIMQLLRSHCLTVSEMKKMTGISQANISQHLQVLRREGVVVAERNGKEIKYCISHPEFITVLDCIQKILSDRTHEKLPINHSTLPDVPKFTDPVCKMKVLPRHTAFSSYYKRTAYYFCASGCKKEFLKNPKKYV
ncbi:MAG: metalloregulator ArsR/SmtB family transcription factor [Patescibacteria group bacterium]|jgi:YHS domain-containing protein/DNA-binding transcriptional ArsR family regulator